MRVVGYVRVSTEEQARGGVSIKSQPEKVRGYCDLYGLDLVGVISDDGLSGKSLDRPGLARALAMLDAGEAGGVVVTKLDRLTRSVADLGRLLDGYFGERAGKQLFSVGDQIDTRSAAGRLVLNVLISVAQWERETIVERTMDGLRYKRERGERISGRIPYGADLGPDGKTLVPNEAERDRITAIRSWASRGRSSRRIARLMNERAWPAKGGGRWNESSVRAILKRHPVEATADGTQAGG